MAALLSRCVEAFFLPSPVGSLAAIHHEPPANVDVRCQILYAHPFGHELYHSRPVMDSAFRLLAEHGISTLALDLPGCGDSEGDFADARWENWLTALEAGFDLLAENRNVPIAIFGLRLGAALAVELTHRRPCHRLISMDAVLSGEELITQYLRLRVVFSGLRDLPERRESTADLRQRLAAGEPLEVAGYVLAPELIAAIDGIQLRDLLPAPGVRVEWLQTQATPPPHAPERWTAEGVPLSIHHAPSRPCWAHNRPPTAAYANLTEALRQLWALSPGEVRND